MIQLAYPIALLSLAAIPVIVALHLLRPRRRRVVLSTTTLWREALEDRTRGLGLARLLRNVSLLLLLAIALVLGLALSGPQWLTDTGERADTVLVLDVSASMKTRAGAGATRFDQALAEAHRIVEGLPREGRMLVMTSGRSAVLKSGFETDRGALRRVLSQLHAGDEAGRPREALALALSLLQGRSQGRIYFLTDGAFGADVGLQSSQIVFRIVGGPARNVAITRFDIRQELAAEDRFQVLLTVQNYTDAAMTVPASVKLEDRTLLERSLELKPRDRQTVVLRVEGGAFGRAVARIEVDDDLAADNQAYAAVNPATPLRVLLFTRGNFYLESVLEALPGLELVKREWSGDEDLGRLAISHDVIVFDGADAPRLPPGNFMLFDAVAPGLPFSAAGRAERPAIVGRGSSALMRGVDLTAVRIERARRLTTDGTAPGLQRLFWARETDLALAWIEGDVRVVYLGFDVAQSNFPLQVAFPLFVSQSLEWLRPRGEGFVSTHIAAGSRHSIRVPAGETELRVRTPSGATATLEAKEGAALVADTSDAGFYQYTAGEATRYFAVSLTDAPESDVNDQWRGQQQAPETPSARSPAQMLVPLWPYLLAAALVLLALEWCVWTWSRRAA